MSDSDETLKQEPTIADLMNLLVGINKRLDAQDIQLEAIREGILHNASRFDRLEGSIFAVRSDISNLKADIRDLSNNPRQQDMTLK